MECHGQSTDSGGSSVGSSVHRCPCSAKKGRKNQANALCQNLSKPLILKRKIDENRIKSDQRDDESLTKASASIQAEGQLSRVEEVATTWRDDVLSDETELAGHIRLEWLPPGKVALRNELAQVRLWRLELKYWRLEMRRENRSNKRSRQKNSHCQKNDRIQCL